MLVGEDGSPSRDRGRVDAMEHSLADSDLHSLKQSTAVWVGLRNFARNTDWNTKGKHVCRGAHGSAQTDLLDPRLHAHMKMVSRTMEEPGREPLLLRAADAALVLLPRWYVRRVSCGM